MITRPYEGKMRVYPQAKESVYQPRVDILGTEGKFTSEQDLSRLRDEFFAKVNEEIPPNTVGGLKKKMSMCCSPTFPRQMVSSTTSGGIAIPATLNIPAQTSMSM